MQAILTVAFVPSKNAARFVIYQSSQANWKWCICLAAIGIILRPLVYILTIFLILFMLIVVLAMVPEVC